MLFFGSNENFKFAFKINWPLATYDDNRTSPLSLPRATKTYSLKSNYLATKYDIVRPAYSVHHNQIGHGFLKTAGKTTWRWLLKKLLSWINLGLILSGLHTSKESSKM